MHFFIDHLLLTEQSNSNGFGPDIDNLTTIYNLTSRFQLSSEAKAFSCQNGQLIIQQSSVHDSLVNAILKPSTLSTPFPVKYFIYRGLLKSSLIDGTEIVPQSSSNNELIARIWDDPPENKGFGILGYDDNTVSGTENIESIFDNSNEDVKPIYVSEGEWFGNFGHFYTDGISNVDYKIGFEIIFNNHRFKINLDHVRAEHIQIDVTNLTGLEEKAKRDKILHFVDPAAFFGTHFDEGINFSEYTPDKQTRKTRTNPQHADYIYSKLLDNFATKNRVYIDVRSEKGYSYNFYENYGDTNGESIQVGNNANPNPQEYKTNGWPIIFSDANQVITGNKNNIRLKLRIDDNTKPIIYVPDKSVKTNMRNSNYLKDPLILTNPITDWSREIRFEYPNTSSGSSKDNIARYIKLYYFRQEHNSASPPTVLVNEKYYDSVFCSIDIPNLGNPDISNVHVKGTDFSYVRELLQDDGTGNFGYTAVNGAYWDNQRILMYSKIVYENTGNTSEKFYLNTYRQKLEINNSEFLGLRNSFDIICREYFNTPNNIRVLGLNYFETDATAARKEKENLILLGLTIEELEVVKNVSGLSNYHDRYVFLESNENNPLIDNSGMRYNEYTVRVQGLDEEGLQTIVTPEITITPFQPQPITVYSRDNQFFSSEEFSENEELTPGTNRIEFHIYHNRCIKINDNIDFSLIHGVQNIYYINFNQNNDSVEVLVLDILQVNKMQNGRIFRTNPNIPPGYVLTHDYTAFTGVNARFSYENDDGDVLTIGSFSGDNNYQVRFRNLGKKSFLIHIGEDPIVNIDLGINFSWHNTVRHYCRPDVMAAFLGTLIELDYEMQSGGFAFSDNTGYPSVTHVNGNAVDTRYRLFIGGNLAEDQIVINTMRNFGFQTIYKGESALFQNLVNALPIGGHNDHLHSGGIILNDCIIDYP